MPAQRDIGQLVDAICEAFAFGQPGQRWAPILAGGRWYTFCNESVNYVCKKMGYTGFDRLDTASPNDAILANEMCAELEKPFGDWMEMQVIEAQIAANQGMLCLAAWSNPSGGPGHVAVVRPGLTEFSGSWAGLSPKIMNIGKDNFIDKKASYAFRSPPKFYVLKDMI